MCTLYLDMMKCTSDCDAGDRMLHQNTYQCQERDFLVWQRECASGSLKPFVSMNAYPGGISPSTSLKFTRAPSSVHLPHPYCALLHPPRLRSLFKRENEVPWSVANAANASKAQKAKEERVACLEQLATNCARTARYTSKHGPSTSRVQKYRRDRSPETVRMERKKDTAARAKARAVQKSKSRKT